MDNIEYKELNKKKRSESFDLGTNLHQAEEFNILETDVNVNNMSVGDVAYERNELNVNEEAINLENINIEAFQNQQLDNNVQIQQLQPNLIEAVNIEQLVVAELPQEIVAIKNAGSFMYADTEKKSESFMAAQVAMSKFRDAIEERRDQDIPYSFLNEYYELREAVNNYCKSHRGYKATDRGARRRDSMQTLLNLIDSYKFEAKLDNEQYVQHVKPLMLEDAEESAKKVSQKVINNLGKTRGITQNGKMALYLPPLDEFERIAKEGTCEEYYALAVQYQYIQINNMAYVTGISSKQDQYTWTKEFAKYTEIYNAAKRKWESTPENRNQLASTHVAFLVTQGIELNNRYEAIKADLGLDGELTEEQKTKVDMKLAMSAEAERFTACINACNAHGEDMTPLFASVNANVFTNPVLAKYMEFVEGRANDFVRAAVIAASKSTDKDVQADYLKYMEKQQAVVDYVIDQKWLERKDKRTEAAAKNYTIEQKAEEYIRAGRNQSGNLVNDYKDSKDSKQMSKLKGYIIDLETSLRRPMAYTEDGIDAIRLAYQEAITHCEKYLEDHKSPSSKEGKRRRELVNRRYKSLQTELTRFEGGVKVFAKQDNANKQVVPMDIVRAGEKEFRLTFDPTAELSRKNISQIQSLTIEDYIAVLGKQNIGGVIFKKGKLQIVENSSLRKNKKFDKWASVLLAQEENHANVMIREHFYALIMDKYGDRITEKDKRDIIEQLDLENGAQVLGSLGRKRLNYILYKIRCKYSDVETTLKVKDEERINQEKNASEKDRSDMVADYIYAQKLKGYLDASLSREELEYRMEAIAKAGRAKGISVPSIGKHERAFLVSGAAMISDEIFASMKRVRKYTQVYNNGKIADAVSMMDLDKIASLVIAKYLTAGADARAVKAKQLELHLQDSALEIMSQNNASIKRRIDNVRYFRPDISVNALAENAAEGLQAEVDKRLLSTRAWKNKHREVQKGTKLLTTLCNSLNQFNKLTAIAESEGLSRQEAADYRKIGADIQQLVTNEENFKSMKLVAKELSGTRFAVGFSQIKDALDIELSWKNYSNYLAKMTETDKADYEEKARKEVLPSETENYINIKGFGKELFRLFKLEKLPSDYVKDAEDNMKNQILAIMQTVRAIPEGSYYEAELTVQEEKIKLIQLPNNQLNIVIQDRVFNCPKTAGQIAEYMEGDVLANIEIFGEEEARIIFNTLKFNNAADGVIMHSRNMCITYLAGKLKRPFTYFNNVSVGDAQKWAKALFENKITEEAIITAITQIENTVHINADEAIELLEKTEKYKKAYDADVEFVKQRRGDNIAANEWNENEEKVKDFLADIIYTYESWITEQNPEGGDRLDEVIDKHYDTVVILLNHPDILKGMIRRLPVDLGGMEEVFIEAIDEFVDDWKIKIIRMLPENTIPQRMALSGELALAKSSFVELEKKIDEGINKLADKIQKQISSQASDIFKPSDENNNEEIGDPLEPGIDADIKKARIKKGKKRLESIMENATKEGSGQGFFIKTIMSTYFTSLSQIDKRAMFGTAIRNLKPRLEPTDGMDEKQKEDLKKKNEGMFLSGLLKGAGPLFQKILQGVPAKDIPRELEDALKDMKSNLEPIPEKVVEAELHNIISSSKGKVTKITVNKALGAASVAQAFMCTMYGPNIPADGKKVVIKLLRPEVKNRMDREKKIMLKSAKLTDMMLAAQANIEYDSSQKGGMEATYEGQLQRIEEEMDFRIEARNAQRGQVYNRGYNTVKSVTVDSLVEPTANAMVLELASGDTLDRYIDSLKNELLNIGTGLFDIDKNKFDLTDEGKLYPQNIDSNNLQKYKIALKKIPDMLKQAQQRQAYMMNLVDNWVREGLFGEGFYHGDLHAGNIMIDDSGVTLIDFGNATILNDNQRYHVHRMVMATAVSDEDIFLDSFHALLEQTAPEVYEAKKDRLKEIFSKVLKMGDVQCAGQRIAAALILAQDEGIELPPAIYNFSQSQIRLQNAVSELNEQIEIMQDMLANLHNQDKSEAYEISSDPYVNLNIIKSTKKDRDADKLERIVRYSEMSDDDVNELSKDLDEQPEAIFEAKYIPGNKNDIKSAIEIYNSIKAAGAPTDQESNINTLLKVDESFRKITPVALELGYSQDKFGSNFQQYFTNKACKREIDNFFSGMEDCGITELIDKYDKYREAKKKGAATVEKNEFINSYKVYKAWFSNGHTELTSVRNTLPLCKQDAENYNDPRVETTLNSILKDWEAQKDTYGAELFDDMKSAIDAYNEYAIEVPNRYEEGHEDQEAEDNRRLDELAKNVIKAYRKALVARLKKDLSEDKFSTEYDDDEPTPFAAAMGALIQSNIKSSIGKLGVKGIIKHFSAVKEMFQ